MSKFKPQILSLSSDAHGIMVEYDKLHLSKVAEKIKAVKDGSADSQSSIIVVMLLYGEARGEGMNGMQSVLQVVWNRCMRRKTDYMEAEILRDLQFSCFNKGDRSLLQLPNEPDEKILEYLMYARMFWGELLNGRFLKEIGGATMYCTVNAFKSQALRWAKKEKGSWDITKMIPVGQVGRHLFFKER